MAKRAGLRRGLDDVPSVRREAAGVLERLSARPGAPRAPRSQRPALRIVSPSEAAATAERTSPEASGAAPSRKAKASKGRRGAARKSRPVAGPVPSMAEESPVAGAAPAAAEVPPVSPRDAAWIKVFYERLGRRVTDLVGETMGSVVRAGLGLEEVIPETVERLFRGFGRLPSRVQEQLVTLLGSTSRSELLDPQTWQGFAMLLQSSLEVKLELMRQRRRGQYEVDEFGLDEEYLFRVQPIFRWLYKKWWRVSTTGLEHVPASGRALFVANHSGVLPYDGAMIATSIWDEHPSPRLVRALYLEWFVSVPFVAPFLQKTGQVMANPENGERLLMREHLVTVFPEGLKGVGKHFKDRYQLARFGRGGFVRMAINSRSPIIPVSVVGAEEIHPVLLRLDFLGRPLGLPFCPVSPTWPLLGPLGLIPLPSKWFIHFGEPMETAGYSREDASDFHLVSQVADHVRSEIQNTIQARLEKRESVFFG